MTVEQASPSPGQPRRWPAFIPVVAFLALAALFFVRLGAGDASRIPSVLIGKAVPQFTLPELEGQHVPGLSDADLRSGEVTVVNVFASWCVPCREEHPLMMQLAAQGVRVVGIAYKDEPQKTRGFLEAGNPYSRIGTDRSGRVAIDFGVTGVPETFVVRGDGTIAYKYFGPITTQALRDEVMPEVRKAGGGA